MGLLSLMSKNRKGILRSGLLQFKNQSIAPTNRKFEFLVILAPSHANRGVSDKNWPGG